MHQLSCSYNPEDYHQKASVQTNKEKAFHQQSTLSVVHRANHSHGRKHKVHPPTVTVQPQ